MQRLKLVPVSLALALALPVIASARVIDDVTPPSPREVEDSAYSRSVDWSTTDSGSSDDDVDFADLKDSLIDGYGGGGAGMYAPPYYGGISVDVSVVKDVTPDKLSISAYCDAGVNGSRNTVRDALKQMFNDIKSEIGTDGKVRRTGGYTVSPYYDMMTGQMRPDTFSGNLNVWVDVVNRNASDRIMEVLEDQGCSTSWTVTLSDMQSVEYDVLDDLITRLNRRRDVFEKLLKTRLSDRNITGAYLSSWIDSWNYDPDSNTAQATVTLSVTFSTGDGR